MSIEAVTWALNVPVGGNAKVILLGLANHAHPDGTEAFPALDTLAGYAHCDRSTARRNVRKLVEDGWAIEDGLGPRGQTKYRLPISRTEGGSKTPPVAKRNSGTGASQGVAPVPPEPSIEPSSSVSARASKRVRVNGREVPRALVDDAVHAIEHYADATGQTVRPFDGNGGPTDSLTRVMSAMVRFPEVRTLWPRMVDRVLAAPWWDGDPSVGVIFGPKVVERSIERARSTASRSRGLSQPEDFAHLFPRSQPDA